MLTPDPLAQLSSLLEPELAAVNTVIRDRMSSEHAPRIPEVTAHLIEAGGKRIRPMLTLATARLLGHEGPDPVKLAATVEFIHTATLLHDDVVDESDQRRGRPTANLLWDNTSSILVGDYLFARAFQLMVETGNLTVLHILSNAAAVIAEGEVLQLTTARNLATDEETYIKVIRGKTAALFAAACEAGAVVSGAPAAQVDALRSFGDAIGISFQMVDDLLDYGGVSASLGKNTGDDLREGKVTLPVILAHARSDDAERAFWSRVISGGEVAEGDLEQAVAIMRQRGVLEETRRRALDRADAAREALDCLPDGEVTGLLRDLAGYVVARVV